jgi:hypothetical protein
MRTHQRLNSPIPFQKPVPCSDDKLRALLARDLGYRSRQSPRGHKKRWLLGLLTFVAALATVVEVTSGSKLELLFHRPLGAKSEELDHNLYQHMQLAELIMLLQQKRGLLASKASIVNLSGGFYTAVPSSGVEWRWNLPAQASTPQYVPPTRTALSAEARREIEFWRVVVSSNDLALYQSYLRHYPTGTFASIAQSKARKQILKAGQMAGKRSPKPLEAMSDQALQESGSSKVEMQCRDKMGCRMPTGTATGDCTAKNVTSPCVKRNYRATGESTAALEKRGR